MIKSLKSLAVGAAFVLALGAVAGPAQAQVTSVPMDVSAIVLNTCTVAALPLAFVDYEPLGGTPTTAQTQITVSTCFDPHEVAIDKCTNGPSTAQRQLTSLLSADILNYSLSCSTEGDPECAANWGDQQNADTLTGVGGAVQLYTVDGVIPEGQEVQSGVYTDICTVSLQF